MLYHNGVKEILLHQLTVGVQRAFYKLLASFNSYTLCHMCVNRTVALFICGGEAALTSGVMLTAGKNTAVMHTACNCSGKGGNAVLITTE